MTFVLCNTKGEEDSKCLVRRKYLAHVRNNLPCHYSIPRKNQSHDMLACTSSYKILNATWKKKNQNLRMCLCRLRYPTSFVSEIVLRARVVTHKRIESTLCGSVLPVTESQMPSVKNIHTMIRIFRKLPSKNTRHLHLLMRRSQGLYNKLLSIWTK